jgi:hypothetical protein
MNRITIIYDKSEYEFELLEYQVNRNMRVFTNLIELNIKIYINNINFFTNIRNSYLKFSCKILGSGFHGCYINDIDVDHTSSTMTINIKPDYFVLREESKPEIRLKKIKEIFNEGFDTH